MRVIVEQRIFKSKGWQTLFVLKISEMKKQKIPMRYTNIEQTCIFRIAVVK